MKAQVFSKVPALPMRHTVSMKKKINGRVFCYATVGHFNNQNMAAHGPLESVV